ncbi:DNA methyltransferase [Acidithiobacillus sp. M4-SHS-6]|uniref:DNA methyltransferase n=1 Tax=Acidithiobacillus sp. M4-SHS-6 TaxID=3383024 RepID=UPI0039BE9CFA
MTFRTLNADLITAISRMPDNYFDAVLCDPPYHLTQNSRGGSPRKCSNQPGDGGKTPYGRHRVGTDTHSTGFMGQTWDGGDVAFRPETWEAVMRVMKPGAYLMAFGGSRTFHRLAVALEDAGFVLVDTLMWLFGSGFPKNHDISKAIDKRMKNQRPVIGIRKHPTLKDTSLLEESANAAHGGNSWSREWEITVPGCSESAQWAGYGTALKPAFEPILLCRKPGEKTYAENVQHWGCGALNIDGCRIPGEPPHHNYGRTSGAKAWAGQSDIPFSTPDNGRWPANVLLDDAAAEMLDAQSGIRKSRANKAGTLRGRRKGNALGEFPEKITRDYPASAGGASRFFYVAKVSTKERQAGMLDALNGHPTLKPIDLTRQLATLLLPPERMDVNPRRLLVPFSGAGSEMIGALLAGWEDVVGIEQSAEYAAIAERRLAHWINGFQRNAGVSRAIG